jgi:hypothetical protein
MSGREGARCFDLKIAKVRALSGAKNEKDNTEVDGAMAYRAQPDQLLLGHGTRRSRRLP